MNMKTIKISKGLSKALAEENQKILLSNNLSRNLFNLLGTKRRVKAALERMILEATCPSLKELAQTTLVHLDYPTNINNNGGRKC